MVYRDNLFARGKLNYARGRRPKVKCIFCAIINNSSKVKKLIVHRSPFSIVSLNLFPYNPGHIILFPLRHVCDFRELNKDEHDDLNCLIQRTLKVIDNVYNPSGYNIGCNIGEWSGRSIEHFHYHIVPRYKNEIGFIDIIAGSKILVDNPSDTLKKISNSFKSL